MQSLKTYFLVALLLGFLVGCSSDDDNIGDDAVSNDTDADTEMLNEAEDTNCLLYTSPSPRDATLSRMPSSA